ncbi:MAG TPA: bifunctional 4-hydroxy-2-oxoglutarate aldolase/2-dehydro-3-deoxy-phosphogluconate aldolase [Anaerolineae bacterium]|nr:bifunctional 4-hydroxy-2-oxoglutarate aldolase/2-dehydro-3-deoxy-phosphogluconate aldolase [Anaerolineae bacterium]
MSAIQQILTQKVVAIIRLEEYSRAIETAQALVAGGISVLEFTMTGKGAIEAVSQVRRILNDSACVGIGSVLKAEEANAAIDAGAQFVVTPTVSPQVIAACVNRATPILAGGFTPTELLKAYEAGSELVKLFPAQQGGPRYVKEILAPLPFLKLVPTGGVSADNLRDYFTAGAVAIGIGGNLISKPAVASGEFEKITDAARTIRQAVNTQVGTSSAP